MTLEEIKELRINAENQIQSILVGLEKVTRCHVSDVVIKRIDITSKDNIGNTILDVTRITLEIP